jgi:hypothetical protein
MRSWRGGRWRRKENGGKDDEADNVSDSENMIQETTVMRKGKDDQETGC